MSYIGTTEIGKMFLGTVEIDKAYLGDDLVFGGDASLPYTVVNYVQTDGTAYINTGKNSANTISAELKVMIPSSTGCAVLGRGVDPGSSSNSGSCILLLCGTSSSVFRAAYTHRYKYLGAANPSIADSVANQTPFECKSRQRKGAQEISILQQGETTWSSRTSTQNDNLGSTGVMYLFRTNNTTALPCPSGTRVYYCKIYSDYNYSTIVFDGIPVLYNGEYGLWDLVSNSFFGNAAGSGAFTGA